MCEGSMSAVAVCIELAALYEIYVSWWRSKPFNFGPCTRGGIEQHIADLQVSIAGLTEDRSGMQISVKVAQPNQEPRPRYSSDINWIFVWVSKKNFDEQKTIYGKQRGWEHSSWEYLRTSRLRSAGFELEQTQRHLNEEQKRFDGWTLKELIEV
jgi:hypothetical protein